MKDLAKLLACFLALVLGGALLAPVLFWSAQILIARGHLQFLAQFDFASFFHRAVLVCAILFLWPLLRILSVRSWRDLGLEPNRHPLRDLLFGALIAGIPLAIAAVFLTTTGILQIKHSLPWRALLPVAATAVVVPLIEETFFRGLLLGMLLRAFRALIACLLLSAFFAGVHFLKSPASQDAVVTWHSGFDSIAQSFGQFSDPTLVLAAFVTLFLIGWILADARLRTRSLWLPMGMHGGWIFTSGLVSKLTRREVVILPWLGNNLLVGLLPLFLGIVSWGLMIVWIRYANRSNR